MLITIALRPCILLIFFFTRYGYIDITTFLSFLLELYIHTVYDVIDVIIEKADVEVNL